MNKLLRQAQAIEDAIETLKRLELHHQSQGKDHTVSVSKKYNRQLAMDASIARKNLSQAFS